MQTTHHRSVKKSPNMKRMAGSKTSTNASARATKYSMTKGFGIKQSKYYQKYGIIATTGRTRDKLPTHKHRASVRTAGGKKR